MKGQVKVYEWNGVCALYSVAPISPGFFASLSSQEWRHAHGMRCLGIPNTAHFANVTQIEDAVSLWAKLKLQKASERWQPDTEEEYEDSSGNMVNKKT